jgi:hypothetical protein
MRLKSATALMDRMGLKPGSPTPSAIAFLEAYEAAFCTASDGQRLGYSGHNAALTFNTLQDLLQGRISIRKKRHVAPARPNSESSDGESSSPASGSSHTRPDDEAFAPGPTINILSRQLAGNGSIASNPAPDALTGPLTRKRQRSITPDAPAASSAQEHVTSRNTVSPYPLPTFRNLADFVGAYRRLPRVADTDPPVVSTAAASTAVTPAMLYAPPPNTEFQFDPALGALNLERRFTPGNGDCLFHALVPDARPAQATIHALRQQVAEELAATPDTAQTTSDNAEHISNYLFQHNKDLWESVGPGIQAVPNSLRAGLEAMPGVYSIADVALPMYCRIRDRQAPQGSRPTVVTLLSQSDGFAVQFSATQRTVLPMRGLDTQWAASTLKPLFDHSDAVLLQQGAHFERVVRRT